jgi:hypothetical protein
MELIAARKIVRALHSGKSPETPRQTVNPDQVSKLFFERALESCHNACGPHSGNA